MDEPQTYTAFAGVGRIASGDLATMLRGVKTYLEGEKPEPVLIFEDATGKQVDFDFRGTEQDVLDRAEAGTPKPGPGRPKLGVVAREVTLLPRHWDWLERQRGGASAALRRLVDEARKREPGREKARLIREAASKVMWSVAGNLPDFEEASRALFAPDPDRFDALIAAWPADLREHFCKLSREAARLEAEDGSAGS
ncbi:DUF2239 family protein [Paludisphaera rhizosphaerae]|uniref:DUF2239 family protein n=1 Tax=Paludisphaera rhizosphaerae TaxID=2711216 RepID=UPI0013ED8523|nr:DUF2239 family protein [Paludisphaera rhizosphaerae]